MAPHPASRGCLVCCPWLHCNAPGADCSSDDIHHACLPPGTRGLDEVMGTGACIAQPGDLLVFSNRRMLHGRDAFAPSRDGGGSRWLQGCYISIDDFANRHNLLRRCFHDDERHGERPTPRHLGNQDWAHRPGSAWLPAS